MAQETSQHLTYCEEIEFLIDKLSSLRAQIELSRSLLQTPTLSWCFLTTNMQLIRGVLASLKLGIDSVYSITARSILEYVVDQSIISQRGDEKTNRQFVKQYVVLLYANRRYWEAIGDWVPMMEANFVDYVIRDYGDIIDSKSPKTDSGLILPDFAATERYMRRFQQQGWLGCSLRDRLKILVVEAIAGEQNLSPISEFDTAEKRAQERYVDAWDRLGHHRQILAVVDQLIESWKPTDTLVIEYLIPLLEHGEFFFNISSNFIHPTVMSVVPHFAPVDESFRLEWSHKPKTLARAEQYLYLLLTSSAFAFFLSLGKDAMRTRTEEFQQWLARCPGLTKWLKE